MPLQMSSSVEGKTARVVLEGELDGSSSTSVRDAVDKALQDHPDRLVLMVEKLNFMASAGLRILIFAKQKQPGLKVYLVKPQETIVDTLKKTGFYQGVYVVETEEETKG